MNPKYVLLVGASLGFLGVALGAFGAHALKPVLAAAGRADTFELAVRFQFYHGLSLLFLGVWMERNFSPLFRWCAISWILGIFLFCGSLYLYALTNIPAFAMATPIGGVAFLSGWLLLILGLIRK